MNHEIESSCVFSSLQESSAGHRLLVIGISIYIPFNRGLCPHYDQESCLRWCLFFFFFFLISPAFDPRYPG